MQNLKVLINFPSGVKNHKRIDDQPLISREIKAWRLLFYPCLLSNGAICSKRSCKAVFLKEKKNRGISQESGFLILSDSQHDGLCLELTILEDEPWTFCQEKGTGQFIYLFFLLDLVWDLCLIWASLVAQLVKNRPAMRETWARSLSWEDPLEKGMATHSSILAWRIPKDRGTWWAAVHGIAKSRTRLSD